MPAALGARENDVDVILAPGVRITFVEERPGEAAVEAAIRAALGQ